MRFGYCMAAVPIPPAAMLQDTEQPLSMVHRNKQIRHSSTGVLKGGFRTGGRPVSFMNPGFGTDVTPV